MFPKSIQSKQPVIPLPLSLADHVWDLIVGSGANESCRAGLRWAILVTQTIYGLLSLVAACGVQGRVQLRRNYEILPTLSINN
jgi:hypothetical protein